MRAKVGSQTDVVRTAYWPKCLSAMPNQLTGVTDLHNNVAPDH